MIELPKNKKVNRKETHNKKIWLYGLPCSGKTFLANQFPNVLMLNTDGNIGQVDAPAIKIADEITIDGRLTKRRYAWDVFKLLFIILYQNCRFCSPFWEDLTMSLK